MSGKWRVVVAHETTARHQDGEPDMTSFLRCAAIIGTMAVLSPVHEGGFEAPELPGRMDMNNALKTLETAKSAGQAIAALDPETRARLLAHVAAAATGETVAAARKAPKP
jgi:hypothetical protein